MNWTPEMEELQRRDAKRIQIEKDPRMIELLDRLDKEAEQWGQVWSPLMHLVVIHGPMTKEEAEGLNDASKEYGEKIKTVLDIVNTTLKRDLGKYGTTYHPDDLPIELQAEYEAMMIRWRNEVDAYQTKVADYYRRQLQRAHLDEVLNLMDIIYDEDERAFADAADAAIKRQEQEIVEKKPRKSRTKKDRK